MRLKNEGTIQPSRSSVLRVEKKLSATALSQQSPLRLMLGTKPWASRMAR